MAITKEEVAEVVRAWCHAWHTRDVETLVAMEKTRKPSNGKLVLATPLTEPTSSRVYRFSNRRTALTISI